MSGGIDAISEEDAKKIIDNIVNSEKLITENKVKLIQELSKIISAKKIIKLKKAEHEFNRRILQEYGKRKRLQNE